MKKIVVTGAAGFIGYHVSLLLLKKGFAVPGVDNKSSAASFVDRRLTDLSEYENFSFINADIEDKTGITELFAAHSVQKVVHLAAKTGVRDSVKYPDKYIKTNVLGTLNLIEVSQKYGVENFVNASSSSVYGNAPIPFAEEAVSIPLSVYGEAGRDDMAIPIFVRKILKGEKVTVFGDGNHSRSFTYVKDVARAVVKALDLPGFNYINIGNDKQYTLGTVISLIGEICGKDPVIEYEKENLSDAKATLPVLEKAEKLLGWSPSVDIREGLENTIEWYRNR